MGFRMPAEWEKQEAVWLSWPHNRESWPGKMLEEVRNAYAQFVKAVHSGQKVKILVDDTISCNNAKSKLRRAGVELHKIIFYKIKTKDAWIRDYGPTFIIGVREKKLAMVKWIFNAWGNKYEDLKEDNKVPYGMNRIMNLPVLEAGIVLEGGSIEVNGSGTLLATEQCLLNKNRNPGLSRDKIEQCLKTYLNVSNILWLGKGIAGDDTDGHIDDIARFAGPNTVLSCFEEDKSDENYKILNENYRLLRNMKDENGNKLNVVKLPMPGRVEINGIRVPASYANFYIGNEAVAVPVFSHKNDSKALGIIQKLFPGRKVVGINCRAMAYGFGALHCLSQQEPKF